MGDLAERFEDDGVLEHDHRVPVFREHVVLEQVVKHGEDLPHEVDLEHR